MWQSTHRTQEAVTHRRPRRQFVPGIKTANTKDHTFSEVRIAWKSREDYRAYTNSLPPFPFQVYILDSARKTLQDPEFPASFVEWFESLLDVEGTYRAKIHAHFEFYSRGFNNVLACTAHQLKEVESRNRNAIWPRIIKSWAPQGGYDGFIIVIDRDHWESNGFVIVDFDGERHHDNEDSWNFSGNNDSVLWAERKTGVKELLRAWDDSGHTWTQQDLERHNRGGFSPALYPAVDPSAHHDADLLDETIPASHSEDEDSESGSGSNELGREKSIYREVTMDDLLRSSADVEDVKEETYESHSGWPTTSVWRASNSKTRPPFAFMLYLNADLVPFEAKAMFACLDRELLFTAAWTLDIVRNAPDMQSALRHYSHEKSQRAPSKTERRSKCMRMLLDKACGPRLPEELLQLIEDILVPPPCSTYSAAPYRVFHDVFLYLDASTQLNGPRLIYHNHIWDRPRIAADNLFDDEPYIGPLLADDQYFQHRGEEILKMHVISLRSWRFVSDELHTIWSLCSPRLKVPPSRLPHFSAQITFPRKYKLKSLSHFYARRARRGKATASLTFHGSEPITLHDTGTLSSQIWYEGIEITDVETNIKLPATVLHLNEIIDQRVESWSEEPKMRKFDAEVDLDAGDKPMLASILPGRSIELPIRPDHLWWLAQYEEGLLKDGREYKLSLKKDFAVTRWTYGSVPGLKGPYNLPPMPVHGENECRFTFLVAPEKERRMRAWVQDDSEDVDSNEESTDSDDDDENHDTDEPGDTDAVVSPSS